MKVTGLPDGVLTNCLSFLGDGNFLFLALVCRSFCDRYKSYLRTENEQLKPTMTSMEAIVASVSRLKMTMKELNVDINDNDNETKVQWRGKAVCFWDAVIRCTSYNGNLDVLVWMKNNNRSKWEEQCNDADKIIFSGLLPCVEAAKGGQLEVLQWLHQNGYTSNVMIDTITCCAAAANGHLDILQWLRQNECLIILLMIIEKNKRREYD